MPTSDGVTNVLMASWVPARQPHGRCIRDGHGEVLRGVREGAGIAQVSRNGLAVIHPARLAYPVVCAATKGFSTRSARIRYGPVLDVITKDK